MDPRHPESAVTRMEELMLQFKRVEEDMAAATTSAQLSMLEREGSLVVQQICLVAPRLHEAMVQSSRLRRYDLSHALVIPKAEEEKAEEEIEVEEKVEEKVEEVEAEENAEEKAEEEIEVEEKVEEKVEEVEAEENAEEKAEEEPAKVVEEVEEAPKPKKKTTKKKKTEKAE